MGVETGRFLRSDRLLDSRDFRRVLRRGTRLAHRDVVLVMTDEQKNSRNSRYLDGIERPGSRLGITASRKTGCAVVRNRFKRRVRAWFREHRREFPQDVDLVVIARRSGAGLSSHELEQRLSGLMGLRDPGSRKPNSPQGNCA